MGTSNWQNIPFGIETIMAIEPRRVLDVGIGFGRWGMLIREFGELWFGRVARKDWTIHIEGVEAFKKNIDDYQSFFYDVIHENDFQKIYRNLPDSWDIVIFGDVLEHFEESVAKSILDWATSASAYVLINIPLGHDWPQEDLYENAYERHLSEWDLDDFHSHFLIRYKTFFDFQGRPFGSFILSKDDPNNLREKLFSFNTRKNFTSTVRDDSEMTEPSAFESESNFLRTELEAIKNSLSYQVANRLATSRLGKLAAGVLKKKR